MWFRRNDRVSVELGEILVGDVQAVARGRRFRVWEGDMHSKYVEVGGYQGRKVFLTAGERTLKADRDKPMTVITLPPAYTGWEVEAATMRYTVRIIAWKPGKRRPSWQETDEQYEYARQLMDKEAAERAAQQEGGKQ